MNFKKVNLKETPQLYNKIKQIEFQLTQILLIMLVKILKNKIVKINKKINRMEVKLKEIKQKNQLL